MYSVHLCRILTGSRLTLHSCSTWRQTFTWSKGASNRWGAAADYTGGQSVEWWHLSILPVQFHVGVSLNGGFPLSWSCWGVKWGYHHLRKHPFQDVKPPSLTSPSSLFFGCTSMMPRAIPPTQPAAATCLGQEIGSVCVTARSWWIYIYIRYICIYIY